MKSDPIDRLHRHLDLQDAAAARGDLIALAKLSGAIAPLLEALDAGPRQTPEALTALRARAARSARRLEAVLQGVRSARRRMIAAQQARDWLESYDSKGQAHRLALRLPNTVEHRA